MLLAPPIAGFALFFCVFHSPRHLGETWRSLTLGKRRMAVISVGITGLSLALAAALTGLEGRDGPTGNVVAATFITFSVLTVPHMLVPMLAGMFWASGGAPRAGG